MTELKLTRQTIPPEQRGLFRGIAPGRPNAELLVWLAKAEGLATVDDLLACEYSGGKPGACITRCGYHGMAGKERGYRAWCPRCETHTICNAQDIATGNTPGPVWDHPLSNPKDQSRR